MALRVLLARPAVIAMALALAACTSANDGARSHTGAQDGDALLPCIAPIVIGSCALAGCHDAVTKEHGMDLSTGIGIYNAWVDVPGVDHCTNSVIKRVVPANPDRSYVMTRIHGIVACNQASPMPPPPYSPLSESDIEAIRSWIAAGATLTCSSQDGGATSNGDAATSPSDTGAPHAESSSGMQDTGKQDGASIGDDTGDPPVCTASQLCTLGECIGDNCDGPWHCVYHSSAPEAHPCPLDQISYCGCDGFTFQASSSCPDRRFDYPGACDDGANCDPADVRCSSPAPSCADGELPAVVSGCYGRCVPSRSCRCRYDWECPKPYECLLDEMRCVPPTVDGG